MLNSVNMLNCAWLSSDQCVRNSLTIKINHISLSILFDIVSTLSFSQLTHKISHSPPISLNALTSLLVFSPTSLSQSLVFLLSPETVTLDNLIKSHILNRIHMVRTPKLIITALSSILRLRVIDPNTFLTFPNKLLKIKKK